MHLQHHVGGESTPYNGHLHVSDIFCEKKSSNFVYRYISWESFYVIMECYMINTRHEYLTGFSRL